MKADDAASQIDAADARVPNGVGGDVSVFQLGGGTYQPDASTQTDAPAASTASNVASDALRRHGSSGRRHRLFVRFTALSAGAVVSCAVGELLHVRFAVSPASCLVAR
jgi:hypothetical protein